MYFWLRKILETEFKFIPLDVFKLLPLKQYNFCIGLGKLISPGKKGNEKSRYLFTQYLQYFFIPIISLSKSLMIAKIDIKILKFFIFLTEALIFVFKLGY